MSEPPDQSPEKAEGDSLSIAVNSDGGHVKVSARVLSMLARPFRWLMPGKTARAVVSEAEASRIAALIAGTAEPRPIDAFLLERHYRKDLERQANTTAALVRAAELLESGYRPGRALPAPAPNSSSELEAPDPAPERDPETTDAAAGDAAHRGDAPANPEWYARWLRDVEDVTSDGVRDLYARLLAGELQAPTSFSMRSLSVLRDLDQPTARLFSSLRSRVFTEGAIPSLKFLVDPRQFRPAMRPVEMMALRDAGLVSSPQDTLLPLLSRKTGSGWETILWLGDDRVRFWLPRRPEPRLMVPVETLTAAGRDLMRIVAPVERTDYYPVLRWLTASIAAVFSVLPGNIGVDILPGDDPAALAIPITGELFSSRPT